MKRKLLMVGRTRYALPLSPSLAQKFDALDEELDVRVLGELGRRERCRPALRARRRRCARARSTAPRSTRCCRSASRGSCGASARTPSSSRAARRPRSRSSAGLSPGSRHASSPTSTATRLRATRLYGSPLRKALSPLGDALARAGLRRADGVGRSPTTRPASFASVGVEPTATFAAFMDLEPFLAAPPAPLPERPRRALRRRARALQGHRRARRRVAARGAARAGGDARDRRPRDARATSSSASSPTSPSRRAGRESLPTDEVARALDEATVLVLPVALRGSRPRRRRGVLPRPRRRRQPRRRHPGSRRRRGERPARAARRRAGARRRARARARRPRARRRLGAEGAGAVEPWLATPEEYARQVRELVDEGRASTGAEVAAARLHSRRCGRTGRSSC